MDWHQHHLEAAARKARSSPDRWIAASLLLGFAMVSIGGEAMATEEPKYKVSRQHGELEVRDYPALTFAEVTVDGERGAAANAGFRLLAAYIFGGNTRRLRIAMTAPVVQARPTGESIPMTAPVLQTGSAGRWIIRFVMPSSYTLATLPTPNDPRVRLLDRPATRFAVLKFSGLARDPSVQRKIAELTAWVDDQHLRTVGEPSLARYDPPWIPWFLRRNEVMIALEVDGGAN